MAAQESFEAESFISGEKTPHPPKNRKNKFVLKSFLGHFEFFLAHVFLSRKLANTDPPLMENSTYFFWNLPKAAPLFFLTSSPQVGT